MKTALEPVLFLRVTGRLRADNVLVLMPSYLTAHGGGSGEDPRSELCAEMIADGRVLLRYGVPLFAYPHIGTSNATLAVRAHIPFPPQTRSVRFLRGGVLVHEIAVSASKPAVDLVWQAPRARATKLELRWKASHAGKLPMQYFVRYSHDAGTTWRRLSARLQKPAYSVDLDALPGGDKCSLEVVATDGVNTTSVRSPHFKVAVKPCIASILAPADPVTVAEGAPLCFRGQGYYLEEDRAETQHLEWRSSRDGKIGSGGALLTAALSAGRHEITLVAGAGGRAGRAVVAVSVTAAKGRKK